MLLQQPLCRGFTVLCSTQIPARYPKPGSQIPNSGWVARPDGVRNGMQEGSRAWSQQEGGQQVPAEMHPAPDPVPQHVGRLLCGVGALAL